MAELLKTTNRAAGRCEAEAPISDLASLLCDLTRDHPGPLHYDRTDGIWWAADDEAVTP